MLTPPASPEPISDEDDQSWGNWTGNGKGKQSNEAAGKGKRTRTHPAAPPTIFTTRQHHPPPVTPVPPPTTHHPPLTRQVARPQPLVPPLLYPQPKPMPRLPMRARARRVEASPGTIAEFIRSITVNVYSCGFDQKGVAKADGSGRPFHIILPKLQTRLAVADFHVMNEINMWHDCRKFFVPREFRTNHIGSNTNELEMFTSHPHFPSWLAMVKTRYAHHCSQRGANTTFSIMCWVF